MIDKSFHWNIILQKIIKNRSIYERLINKLAASIRADRETDAGVPTAVGPERRE